MADIASKIRAKNDRMLQKLPVGEALLVKSKGASHSLRKWSEIALKLVKRRNFHGVTAIELMPGTRLRSSSSRFICERIYQNWLTLVGRLLLMPQRIDILELLSFG